MFQNQLLATGSGSLGFSFMLPAKTIDIISGQNYPLNLTEFRSFSSVGDLTHIAQITDFYRLQHLVINLLIVLASLWACPKLREHPKVANWKVCL